MVHVEVADYITDNIFNSDSFVKLDEDRKRVAINTATNVLYLYFTMYNPDKRPIPTEAIAYQTLWEIDKVQVRISELGIASTSIEGMTQTFRGMDRTIAPEVKRLLRKRVGRYNLPVSDTHRRMMIDD